ncbi:MAG: bifunctional DNA primase/polymerase [bacterium]|nr:bifunctional DNA primase/polymerase [bacterium]
MAKRIGARPEAWQQWSALGAGPDLLPAVADQDAVIAPESKLQSVGKVPSRYNSQRQVVGIAKWTQHQSTPAQIERWSQEPDYSLSVQTRQHGAVDVDVDDPAKSVAIRNSINEMLGPCPVRYRDNSGKLLIPFKRSFAMPKRVLPVVGGMIEILGDGQQFIADGMHPSGSRYLWNGTTLPEMPVLDSEKLEALCSMLEMCFGTDSWKISREKRDGAGQSGGGSDEVAAWLVDNWETHGEGNTGEVYIRCPFDQEHTTDSGPTATAYFPSGTGGYAQGHFVCLHAHCAGREDSAFLDATGYSVGQFADLASPVVPDDQAGREAGAEVDLPWPELKRDKIGILPTQINLFRMCLTPHLIRKKLAYDMFKDELIWAPWKQLDGSEQWRPFTDRDYAFVRMELEMRGVKPMGKDLLRETIRAAGLDRTIDTAQEWLSRLVWDGVERIGTFCALGWGWRPDAYGEAVSRYIWTGLAGRVLEPGCQADMTPILVGPQGAGKTTAIKAMTPAEECYVSIPLDGHDTDTSRRLRGKLIGELEELRGLNSRGIEAIKAWITRTTEGWIPKYMEFESTFKRRLLFFGTTNEDEFLADPTGERRFLPGRCGKLDVEWIKDNREQLWAEGAAKFMIVGVDWEGAQTLGQLEHHEFKVTDDWEGAVYRWLIEPQINGQSPSDDGHVTTSDVLSGAVNIPLAHQDRSKQMRMGKVLREMGWERRKITIDDKLRWAYVKDK